MSVYNGERYLRECVESILCQTFRDFEFVIIDDCSTDSTSSILDEYVERDSRVRVIRNEKNLTLPGSLNKGLNLARCALVARMDDDDISLPERLDKQVDYLDRHEDCVVVGCRILSIDEDGDPICHEWQAMSHEEIEKVLLRGRGAMPHPGVMFRRDHVLALGGYREQFPVALDVDLWLRLAEQGRLANLEEILVKYRRHFRSLSCPTVDLRAEAEVILKDTYRRRGMKLPANFMASYPRALSEPETRIQWSQLAAYDGFHRTARKHALLALRQAPFSVACWKAAVRVLLYWTRLRRPKERREMIRIIG